MSASGSWAGGMWELCTGFATLESKIILKLEQVSYTGGHFPMMALRTGQLSRPVNMAFASGSSADMASADSVWRGSSALALYWVPRTSCWAGVSSFSGCFSVTFLSSPPLQQA